MSENINEVFKKCLANDDQANEADQLIGPSKHPFMIVKEEDFQQLRDRLSGDMDHPNVWDKMKIKAVDTIAKGYDIMNDTEVEIKKRLWVLNDYIGSVGLMYVLSEDIKEQRKYTNLVLDAIRKIGVLPIGDNLIWAQTVPIANILFTSILCLDIIHNGLTLEELNDIEAFIDNNVNKIDKEGHWELARYGLHGTWEIYKGKIPEFSTNINLYYDELMETITREGASNLPSLYAFDRFAFKGRLVKSGYMHILEYMNIDNRYYNNKKIAKFYVWLFTHSMTPAKRFWTFGDSTYCDKRYEVSDYRADSIIYSVGNFSEEAAKAASILTTKVGRPGDIYSYILAKEELPSHGITTTSKIYPEAGAYFYEGRGTIDEIAIAFSNPIDLLHHYHADNGSMLLAGFGETLLLNTGYNGWEKPCLGVPFDVIRKVEKHNNIFKVDSEYQFTDGTGDKGGVHEGFISQYLDYASGFNGRLQEEDIYRSVFLIKGEGDIATYAFVVDEVLEMDSARSAMQYIHPNTLNTTGLTTVIPNKQYTAHIDGHVVHHDTGEVKLEIYYVQEPDETVTFDSIHASYKGSFMGKSLEAIYKNTKKYNVATILYPYEGQLPVAFNNFEGKNYKGAEVIHNEYAKDYILTTTGEEVIISGMSFNGKVLFITERYNSVTSYFVRQGTSLHLDEEYGFSSTEPISLYMKGDKGKLITKSETMVTITGFRGKGVKLNNEYTEIENSTDYSNTFNVQKGEYDLEIIL